MPAAIKPVPEWFMLNGVEVGSRAKRILGAVVPNRNKSNPFTGYRPNYDTMDSKDLESIEALWKDIWEDDAGAVSINEFVDVQNRAYDGGVGGRVKSVLRAFAKQRLGKDVEVIGGQTKRYTIDNSHSNMEDTYASSKAWFNEVKKLHNNKKNGQLFFVTGVQVCWDLKVRYEEEKLIEIDATAAAPDAVAGLPSSGDLLAMSGKYYRRETRTAEVTFSDDRVVFAVRYHRLEPIYEPGPKRFFVFKSDSQLTGYAVGDVFRGNLSSYASPASNVEDDFYELQPLYFVSDDDE